VKEGRTHQQPTGCPDDLFAIMGSCWTFQPNNRPTFPALVQSLGGLLSGEAGELVAGQAGASMLTPTYSEFEAVYLKILSHRISTGDVDNGGTVELDQYRPSTHTAKVGLREAVGFIEAYCGCNLQEELDLALSFAKRFRASKHGQKYGCMLTINDIATIHLYTQETPLYKKMNATLGGWSDDKSPGAVGHYLPFARLLIAAMDKLEPLTVDVYRGVHLPIEIALTGKIVGDILTWGAFTSTSLSPDVLRDPQFLGFGAKHGKRVVFIIRVRSGVKVQYFSDKGSAAEYFLGANPKGEVAKSKDDGNVSYAKNEEEVMLKPGTEFKIIAIVPRAFGITEVQMEEVYDDSYEAPISGALSDDVMPTGAADSVSITASAGGGRTMPARATKGDFSNYSAAPSVFMPDANTYAELDEMSTNAVPLAPELADAEPTSGCCDADPILQGNQDYAEPEGYITLGGANAPRSAPAEDDYDMPTSSAAAAPIEAPVYSVYAGSQAGNTLGGNNEYGIPTADYALATATTPVVPTHSGVAHGGDGDDGSDYQYGIPSESVYAEQASYQLAASTTPAPSIATATAPAPTKTANIPTAKARSASQGQSKNRKASCQRPSPTGGTCLNAPSKDGLFCKGHSCPVLQCSASKSSSAQACHVHAVGGGHKPPRYSYAPTADVSRQSRGGAGGGEAAVIDTGDGSDSDAGIRSDGPAMRQASEC
jgi:hypothetical protein